MTVATLRPNSTTATSGVTLTGGASVNAVTSDDSDASYATLTGASLATCGLTTSSLPSGAVTKQMRSRVRASFGGGTSLTVEASYAAEINEQWSFPIVANVVYDYEGAYTPVTLTQAQVDGMLLTLERSDSGLVRLLEAYLDLVYVAKPVVTVTTVSPDPYTASSVIPVSWSNTLDSDGGAQTRYQIRVLTAALDPVSDTGVLVGSANSAEIGPLPNGDYTVNVRVGQTVNGATHWSDYDSDSFTVTVDTADVDTITATAVDASGKITVDVAHDGTSEAWEFIEVQRSIDGKTTWQDVRFATYVDCTADTDDFAVDDYEVTNGADAWYRARATWIDTGGAVTGDWVETSAAESWSSSDCWLKSPTDPTLNTIVIPEAPVAPLQRARRQGKFSVVNAATPVVVSDVRSARTTSMVIGTTDESEADDVEALLEEDVLLFHPDSTTAGTAHVEGRYWSPGYLSEAFWTDFYSAPRWWFVELTEVDAPSDPTAGR
jgi:hypothetical protein